MSVFSSAPAADGIGAYLDELPSSPSLQMPVHHGGWSAGRIEGHFETQPSSVFVALDEAMAAAANTVRGDAFGDDVAEDFLLTDMVVTTAGEAGPADVTTEYEASMRRGRSGKDGVAEARTTGHPISCARTIAMSRAW